MAVSSKYPPFIEEKYRDHPSILPDNRAEKNLFMRYPWFLIFFNNFN